MSTLLATKELSVQYQDATSAAVHRVSLSVTEGEIVVVVGESGSGKTTLLKTMAGLLEPSVGKVLFDGKLLPPPSRRLVPGHPDIRMVFQDFGLSPNLSVYENIDHVLRRSTPAYRAERVQELINHCQLSGLEEHLPKTLSGGEKQRLALARALAEEPRLLLMDEPFGQVDTVLKQQLMRELTEFLQESTSTVVMVTHNPQDALGLADQVIVMKDGVVAQRGAPRELYEQPNSAYVAQLFGPVSIHPVEFWQKYFPHQTARSLGIRAENVQLIFVSEADHNPPSNISATVVRKDYQGFYERILLEVDGHDITAFHFGRVPDSTRTIGVKIDPTYLIPFE